MLCWLSLAVAEATEGGLNCFAGVSVKVSGLEGLACWSSTTRKEVSCPLLLDSADQVGCAGLLAYDSLGWLRCIPLQLMLVAVAVEMSVAQMLKLYLSS